jgi:hypothetical protein
MERQSVRMPVSLGSQEAVLPECEWVVPLRWRSQFARVPFQLISNF